MKFLKSLVAVVGIAFGSLFLAAQNAAAAIPTEVSTALSDAKSDGMSIAGLVLGVIIAIAALKYARRAL
jgi:uncharacterized membrane protein (Fun14 family)